MLKLICKREFAKIQMPKKIVITVIVGSPHPPPPQSLIPKQDIS